MLFFVLGVFFFLEGFFLTPWLVSRGRADIPTVLRGTGALGFILMVVLYFVAIPQDKPLCLHVGGMFALMAIGSWIGLRKAIRWEMEAKKSIAAFNSLKARDKTNDYDFLT